MDKISGSCPQLTNSIKGNMFCSLAFTFVILEGMCFPWRAFGNWSKQRFWCPERVWSLMDFWQWKQTFAQAALGPGAGDGLGLEAVPHLLGAGLEGAQSSLLARGVLIAGPVPAADHRLRGEAVHVCDHPQLRPNPPQQPPSHALSRTKAPNSSSFLHDPLSLDEH